MLDRHGETLKTLVGMGLDPSGFLLPVKEQVVDPNDPFRVVDFLFCN